MTLGLLPLAASAQEPDAPTPTSTPTPTKATSADSDRLEAMRLYQDHKFAEAAEWWQRVVVEYPEDMDAHEALGASLLHRAAAESDQKTKLSDRLLARSELVHAQKLGDSSDLCRALLSTIPEDARESPAFNAQAMEHVVTRIKQLSPGAMEAELSKYAVLLELKPGNYFAAQEIGLNYVQLKQWDKAEAWYAKAVQIEPDGGGAYGNWVDMLVSIGKMKEAREKLVQGLLVSNGTYTSLPLNMWLNANYLKLKKIDIKVPYEYPTGKTTTMIVVDPAWLGKDDGRDAWLMYPRTRRLWKNEKYFNEFHMTGYRHSLAEEVAALSQVVAAFNEKLANGNVKEPDPALMLLSRFQAEGLLEAFILLVERDEDVNIEFYRYRIEHRDKLMEFADKYIIPPLP